MLLLAALMLESPALADCGPLWLAQQDLAAIIWTIPPSILTLLALLGRRSRP